MITDLVKPIKLLAGSHPEIAQTAQGCFMNVIAYLNGEPEITDYSPCVCVVVRPIAIWINDYLLDSERHVLLPYIERAMGSATLDRRELLRRTRLAVEMAYEIRDTGWRRQIAARYSSHAAAAALAAATADEAEEIARYAGEAAGHAVRVATYAARGSEHGARFPTNGVYSGWRMRVIRSCLRFLDESLPKADVLEQSAQLAE